MKKYFTHILLILILSFVSCKKKDDGNTIVSTHYKYEVINTSGFVKVWYTGKQGQEYQAEFTTGTRTFEWDEECTKSQKENGTSRILRKCSANRFNDSNDPSRYTTIKLYRDDVIVASQTGTGDYNQNVSFNGVY